MADVQSKATRSLAKPIRPVCRQAGLLPCIVAKQNLMQSILRIGLGECGFRKHIATHKRYKVSFSQSLAANAYAQHPADRFGP